MIPLQATEAWLRQNHPDCFYGQKHLVEGTVEKAYWNYGYLAALREIAKLLKNSGEEKG